MYTVKEVVSRIICSVETYLNKKIHFSIESLNQLYGIFEYKKYDKGSLICKEGQVDNYIYYISKGLVRQYYFKKDRDVTEHLATDNDMIVCIESYARCEPSRIIIEALEPTELYRIHHDKIEELSSKNIEIQNFYFLLTQVSLITSQYKADLFRLETAQERYNSFLKNKPEILKRTPLQYIASYLLMTPESLSRVRAGKQ